MELSFKTDTLSYSFSHPIVQHRIQNILGAQEMFGECTNHVAHGTLGDVVPVRLSVCHSSSRGIRARVPGAMRAVPGVQMASSPTEACVWMAAT